jgi:hypothetical protein
LKESLDRKEAAIVSFEAEVNLLNSKAKSLQHDLAERKKLDESGQDPFQVTKSFMEQNSQLEEKHSEIQRLLDASRSKIQDLETSERSSKLALSVAREKLAVITTAQSMRDRNAEAEDTIQKLQRVWEEIGI